MLAQIDCLSPSVRSQQHERVVMTRLRPPATLREWPRPSCTRDSYERGVLACRHRERQCPGLLSEPGGCTRGGGNRVTRSAAEPTQLAGDDEPYASGPDRARSGAETAAVCALRSRI